MTDLEKKPLPLYEMMKKASNVLALVESGDTAETACQKVLGTNAEFIGVDNTIGIPEKVDNCIVFLDALKMNFERCKEYEDEYKRKRVAAKNALDGFKNYLKFCIDANP